MNNSNNELTEEQVVKFLQNSPHFFAQHLELLNHLTIPHSQKGTLSLVEMQLESQRERIKSLEQELALLQQLVHQEQDIFLALMPLQKQLSTVENLEQGIAVLNQWAKKFELQQAKLLLFRDKWNHIPHLSENFWLDRKGFELIRLERFGLRRFYLGELTNREKSLLFLPEEFPIGSVACCLVGGKSQQQGQALLIFAAHDTLHFHNGQDTAFLKHLVNIVDIHLHRWLLAYQK
ncbi:DUF484 family protein [Pasteurellaceae bacterium 22721_9_1]